MSAWMGWGLAVLAVAAGYVSYGWTGVLMAVTAIVFWLLLQFSRAMRVMSQAGGSPPWTGARFWLTMTLAMGLTSLAAIWLTRRRRRQSGLKAV